MSAQSDRRIHPWRADLAAAFLKDRVKAPRYVEGRDHQVATGLATLYGEPDKNTPAVSQLLYGEVFTVFEEKDGWAWGQNATDDYVGYVKANTLSRNVCTPTHLVSALRTYVYSKPNLKSATRDALSLNGRVCIIEEDANFTRIGEDAWVFLGHLAPLEQHEPDYAKTALSFLHCAYLWGGRSSMGIDCSGLVQMSLLRAGHPCPRDSDLQKAALGEVIASDAPLKRGDLIFSPGHVAIAIDATHAVHASAAHMAVAVDPIASLFKPGLSSIRRLG